MKIPFCGPIDSSTNTIISKFYIEYRWKIIITFININHFNNLEICSGI